MSLPPEIQRVAREGLRVHAGLWRRRAIELWGLLAASRDQEDLDRRRNMASYVHSVYEQAQRGRVRSPRWSVSGAYRCTPLDPLLHMISRRRGRLREAVIADDGHVLTDLDFRASHPWLIAGLTGDERLRADLEAGVVYESIAGALSCTREQAKLVLLALTNGGKLPALGGALGCDAAGAEQALQAVRALYPGTARVPRDRSWTTPLGRPVSYPASEPVHGVIGWRLQSIESDALLIALRELQHLRVVMEVHDQIIIEVPEGQAEAVAAEAAAVMDRAIRQVAGLDAGAGPSATVKAAIVRSWAGVDPDLSIEDPGGPLELPSGPVGADGPWSPREALQAVLDGSPVADLHASPWLASLHNHEDLLSRVAPKQDANRVRTGSRAASKAQAKAEKKDRRQDRPEPRQDRPAGRPERGGQYGDDMRAAVGAPEGWPSYPIPPGWSVDENGSIKRIVSGDSGEDKEVLVAIEPWYVLQSLRDFDSGRAFVEIGFLHRGRWSKRVVGREVLRSSAKIVELASEGVDVRSTSNKNAVDWASTCEPRTGAPIVVTTRTGWHDDTYVAGPDGPITLVDPNSDFTRWKQNGTFDGWKAGLRRLHEAPVMALSLAFGCIGPLLVFLDLDHNPMMDLSGPSCSGKTTSGRLVSSAYAAPTETGGGGIRTWGATLVGLERTASAHWDVVLILDDTARARKPEMVRDAIYELVAGCGVLRGAKDQGGVGRLPMSKWRNVVFNTGEAPVIDQTEAGGARARPLCVTTTPACPSLDLAQEIEETVSQHYGHLAPALAKMAQEVGGERIRAAHRKELNALAEGGGDTRMLSTAAAVIVAAKMLLALGVPLGEGWRSELDKAVSWSRGAANQGGRALDVVREELARNGAKYYRAKCEHIGSSPCGPMNPLCKHAAEPHGGWRGVWRFSTRGEECAGIYPEVLKRVLSDAGHANVAPIVKRWVVDGVMPAPTNGMQTQGPRLAAGQPSLKLYAFRIASIGLLEVDTSLWDEPEPAAQNVAQNAEWRPCHAPTHGAGAPGCVCDPQWTPVLEEDVDVL